MAEEGKRGRPARAMPPRIDADAETIAERFMQMKPPGPAVDFQTVYRCAECKRKVEWPDILYDDGKCEGCQKTPA